MIEDEIEFGLYPRIKVALISGDNYNDVKAPCNSGFDVDLSFNYQYGLNDCEES